MSFSICILTPDPDGELGGTRWPEILSRLVAPLEAAGLAVESLPWTRADDLARFDLILPILAWGYHRDGDWQGAVAAWRETGVPLRNPAEVLAWNADKSYLARLAEKGAPIVPTIFVERVDEGAVHEAAAAFGTERLIVKPRVSAGAFQTIRWSPGTSLAEGPDQAAMIQPYLPDIEAGGEPSLIYLGGAFSHAVSKVPRPGDFRVQPEYDGRIAAYTPLAEELAAAEAALKAANADILYARVDLVRDLGGRPVLMELELVEPDLYLQYDPDAPARFARAVAAAAAR